MSENQTGGVSRRDLLKKGAVAGGIVWTAPVVMSLGDVAAASSHPPCNRFFYLKYSTNPSTGEITGSCEEGIGSGDCHDGLIEGYNQGRNDIESGCGTAYDPVDNYVVLDIYFDKLTTNPLIQNVLGYTKAGDTGCEIADVDAEAVSTLYPNGGHRVTFPRTAGGAGASHVEISFCIFDPNL